jgi:uncharacterized peroxidase-related enzyme
MSYPIHTPRTAPEAARATLAKISETWGFLPNLGAVLAESPPALELLWVGYAALSKAATLTPAEQQLVCVAASRANGCVYCVAAHSTLALGARLSAEALQAARNGHAISDARLEALRATTERLVTQRGLLEVAEQRAFFEAGFSHGQLLEVLGWICLKTLTNYTNHIASTPVDPEWQGQAWLPDQLDSSR